MSEQIGEIDKLQSEIVYLDHAHGVYVEMYDRLKKDYDALLERVAEMKKIEIPSRVDKSDYYTVIQTNEWSKMCRDIRRLNKLIEGAVRVGMKDFL